MSEHSEEARSDNGGGLVFWGGVSTVIALMLLLGWYFAKGKPQPTPDPVQMAKVDCAPIPDGMSWNGKKLVPASVSMASVEPPEAPPVETDWTDPIEAGFPALGYSWMTLNLVGDAVHVEGETSSRPAKAEAFAIATRAIRSANNGAHADASIINDIRISQGPADWASDMDASLKGLGFDWLDFSVRGPVATVSGTAPTAEARDEAYRLASAAVTRNTLAAGQVERVVNGITVEGEDTGAAEALVELSNSDDETLSVEACSSAFKKTMQGRNIQFETASAQISSESAQLLDALSGIAMLCVNTNGHSVEIGGHSDARGAAGANQQLSLQRAASVRDYLIDLGVDDANLTAIGYGESQLLDQANTPEAHAVNRRTEFKVTATQ